MPLLQGIFNISDPDGQVIELFFQILALVHPFHLAPQRPKFVADGPEIGTEIGLAGPDVPSRCRVVLLELVDAGLELCITSRGEFLPCGFSRGRGTARCERHHEDNRQEQCRNHIALHAHLSFEAPQGISLRGIRFPM